MSLPQAAEMAASEQNEVSLAGANILPIPPPTYQTIGPLTHTHFTQPTTFYWQSITPTAALDGLGYRITPPYQYSYPAALTTSTSLLLPIRPLGKTTNNEAVASLALPHASNTVVRELARVLANKVKAFEPEVVIGLPTGGLVIAPFVAENLGFDRHIPFGYTRKPWFDDKLSLTISCIYTEGAPPRIYLDPNLLSLVQGKRIALIDDVVSTGSTMKDTLKFLEQDLGLNVVCVGVGMLQGMKWKEVLGKRAESLVGAVESPLLKAVESGWVER